MDENMTGDAAVAEAAESLGGAPALDTADPRDEQILALQDRVVRALAETENVRRRLERDREDGMQYAMTGFARDLLTVADNLARAIAAVPAEARADGAVAALVGGVEATERELVRVLARHGVSRVETVGQPLDPNRHQAMLEVDGGEGVEPGTIVAELQAGYVIKDRLLRPALVSVAKAG